MQRLTKLTVEELEKLKNPHINIPINDDVVGNNENRAAYFNYIDELHSLTVEYNKKVKKLRKKYNM